MQNTGPSLGERAVATYLSAMIRQHEEIFARLENVEDELLWLRPAPGAWSIGENLDHARVLFISTLPLLRLNWILFQPYARLRRKRSYAVQIDNVYQRPNFPQNVGWLWPPRHTPTRPTSLTCLKEDIACMHQQMILFYRGKPADLLGNTPLFDPVIGWMNLIQVMQVGLYHDQLHYRTVGEILSQLRAGAPGLRRVAA